MVVADESTPRPDSVLTRDARARRRLLLGAVAAPLAACSPAGRTVGAPVTLVFKHAKLFGDPGPLRALLDAFERRNPGIRVRDETLPSSSDAQHQFYAINLQAHSPAFDVFAADVIWVAGFARAGWLRDLSELLPDHERAALFAGPMRAVTHRRRPYAFPWYVDAGLLYFRSDLLARHGHAPPRTWSGLVRAAQAVCAREPGLRGFIWQGRQYEGLVCNALEYLWSNGGQVFDDGRVVLDSEANRTALSFMVDLVHRYRVSPGSVTTATEEPSRHLFGQGRALFMRNWPYAWTTFADPASRVHGAVGISVLPHFPGGMSTAALGGWQLAVNAYSRAPDAAMRLVAWLGSVPAQKSLALAYGFQPSRVALYDDADLLAAQPALATLREVFANARPRPVMPRYVRVSQVLQTEFSAALSRVRPVALALASAQRGIERIVADAH